MRKNISLNNIVLFKTHLLKSEETKRLLPMAIKSDSLTNIYMKMYCLYFKYPEKLPALLLNCSINMQLYYFNGWISNIISMIKLTKPFK